MASVYYMSYIAEPCSIYEYIIAIIAYITYHYWQVAFYTVCIRRSQIGTGDRTHHCIHLVHQNTKPRSFIENGV